MIFRLAGARLLTVVVLAAIGIGVRIEASSYRPVDSVPAGSLGTFVGYNWYGTPHTISADWRVPRLGESATGGSASTWIGVQSATGAFVQIGIIEVMSDGGLATYAGFWSDDVVEFHPQPIALSVVGDGSVEPGDLITVSLTARPNGWRLHLLDARSRLTFDHTVPIAMGGFNVGEWLQEDPTDGLSLQPLPYPTVGAVKFTHLRVNGHEPTLQLRDATWMSLPGRDFAPTALVDDSFSVIPVSVNLEQAEFLAATTPYEEAARLFDDTEGTWRAHPPTAAEAVGVLDPFLAALRSNDKMLAKRAWPPVPSADIEALIRDNVFDAKALTALADAEPKPSRALLSTLARGRAARKAVLDRIDGALGLPG